MLRTLRILLLVAGVACVAIGAYHFVLGIDSVPGEAGTGATVDSRERFYNAIFLGYGVAWLAAARRTPIRAADVRWLAGIMFLGGLGRILSILVHGQPHWFQLPLAGIELVAPPVLWWLAGAATRRDAATVPG
jgi:hypothetical protein